MLAGQVWKETLLPPNGTVEVTCWTQQAASRDEATDPTHVRGPEGILQACRIRRGNGCRCRARSRLAPRIVLSLAAAACNGVSRDDELGRERLV